MTKAANDNDDGMIVTLTRTQLKTLVREAVREELDRGHVHAEYLNAEDVARMLACTPESVAKYAKRDGLPHVRVGKLRRYLREDVLAWLEERRSQPRSHKARHVQAINNVRQFQK